MTRLETAVPPGTDGAEDAEDDQPPDPGSTAIPLPALQEDGVDAACYSSRRCRCGEAMQALHSPTGHAWRCLVCGRRQKR